MSLKNINKKIVSSILTISANLQNAYLIKNKCLEKKDIKQGKFFITFLILLIIYNIELEIILEANF